MSRDKSPDPPMEVPAWFFTYTDVITLLMTFFVLLLTFATSEPEQFERMQIALFGGGGGTGIAGQADSLEKDTVLIRERPRSSRMTSRGSEMPPIHSDASNESLASGLEGLDEQPTVKDSDSYAFDVPISLLVTDEGEITPVGAQYLRMFARRLKSGSHRITFEVARDSDLDRCLALCSHLVETEHLTPGLVAASVVSDGDLASKLRIIMNHHESR